jgi:Ca2+-binding RTX toxin-like protein
VKWIVVTLVSVLCAGGTLVPAAAAASAPPEAQRCRGLAATIVGDPGGGTVRGTPGPDVIVGSNGNDLIGGRGGDDVICGGAGLDFIDGQGGDDRVYGGADRDVLESYRGSDELRGGSGDDDLISYSEQPVRLYGGSGSDSLRGNVTDEPGHVFDSGGDLDDMFLTVEAAGPLVVIRRGPGTITREGVVTGRYRGNEFLGVDGLSPLAYYGTGERDFVIVGLEGLPFHAETYGGPDFVDSRATLADDYIDAGAGNDVVKAGDGNDTCLHAEKAKGCELLG